MCSPEASPVSLFPQLESVEAQTITATSGRRCVESYRRSGPLGLLLKTLMESQRWSNPVLLLKWDVRVLSSARVTDFTDTNHETPSPSNESAVISSEQDIRSNRVLFRLVPSARPIDVTESSSLPILKTPSNMDFRSERLKSKGVSGTSGTLAQEIMSGYAAKRGLMLPTPMTQGLKVCDNSGKTRFVNPLLLPTPTAMEGTKWANTYNPNSQMGTSLSAMAGSGMLPTPTARDYKNPSSPDGKRIKRKLEQGYTIELNDLIPAIVAEGTLPTPTARDWRGRTTPGVTKQSTGTAYGETLPDTIDRLGRSNAQNSSLATDGGHFRLSPLFSEEMMGFPFLWTTLPFLSHSGEKEPSKHTETQ